MVASPGDLLDSPPRVGGDVVESASIRILEDGKVKKRDITLSLDRLTYGKKRDIERRIAITKFGRLNLQRLSSATEEQKNDPDGAMSFYDDIDIFAWQDAQEDAQAELTQIVWGIEDLDLDKVSATDFERLIEKTKQLDLLGEKKS